MFNYHLFIFHSISNILRFIVQEVWKAEQTKFQKGMKIKNTSIFLNFYPKIKICVETALNNVGCWFIWHLRLREGNSKIVLEFQILLRLKTVFNNKKHSVLVNKICRCTNSFKDSAGVASRHVACCTIIPIHSSANSSSSQSLLASTKYHTSGSATFHSFCIFIHLHMAKSEPSK